MEVDLERKVMSGKIEFSNLALTVSCRHNIITLIL